MEHKQTKENTKHTNIRLEIDLYNEIMRLGKVSERTVSEQIRFMLKEYIRIKNS